MVAPDKIYVPQHNIEAENVQEFGELIVTGSTEYIRKDVLLEWAKEKENYALTSVVKLAYKTMIDKIESL